MVRGLRFRAFNGEGLGCRFRIWGLVTHTPLGATMQPGPGQSVFEPNIASISCVHRVSVHGFRHGFRLGVCKHRIYFPCE